MPDDLGALVAKLQADVSSLKSGLREARQDFTSFQDLIETGAAQVRKVLSFAGISLGFYALMGEAKAFASSILEVGQKSEVLRGAAYAIGEYYNISSQAIDLYVNKLTQSGVSTENALQSINNFLKAGLSIDLLPQVAAAAKDLAPTMAMPFNEAFNAIIQSVTKGTPKALAELTPGLKQAVQAASSETQKMMDSTILSGTEKAQLMLDFVLAAAKKMEGAGDSMAGTYMKQINDYARAVREAKEALFEIVKPVSMAITGQEIKSWQDLYIWVNNNKEELKKLSAIIVIYVEKIGISVKAAINFVYAHKEMFKILLEIYAISKAAGWFSAIIAGATVATGVVGGLSGALKALLVLVGGPWKIVITIALLGLYEAYKAIRDLRKEAGFTPKPFNVGGAIQEGRGRDRAAMDTVTSESNLGAEAERRGVSSDSLAALIKENTRLRAEGKPMKPLPSVQAANETPEERARREADDAAAKAREENKLPPKTAKGGKGAKESTDSLLAPMLAMYKAKREAELQEAQNSLELLKSTNNKKRAELEKDLAEGVIDGQTYYQRLQELQQQETDAALAMIEKKKAAQAKAYQESLTEIEADPKMSAEAKSIARQKMAAENQKTLSKLALEGAQAKLDGEVKVTNELKRQVEVQEQFNRKVEDLELSAAWGPIEEQDAKLRQMTLEWQRAKKDAIEASASTDQLSRMKTAYDSKTWAASPEAEQAQGLASSITSSFSSLASDLASGTADLKESLNSMFEGVFNEALKPGLKSLEQLLMNGFKELFGAVGGAVGSAIMGVIGLVGMLLTSSSSSSFSSSGVTSSVTSSEAVRGIIAGDTTVAIAEVADSLSEAVAPHLGILRQIEENTRNSGVGGSSQINVTIQGVQEAVRETLEAYFREYLLTGANG